MNDADRAAAEKQMKPCPYDERACRPLQLGKKCIVGCDRLREKTAADRRRVADSKQ